MTRTSTSAASDAAEFRRRLNRWYRQHGRHQLPWRLTRDPYAVLVSEVMLQQTQVERVLPYWSAWLERWPGFERLAAATPAEVIREWRGLGYNRRGLALHQAAVAVVERFAGQLPAGEALRELPGIGPYTASAIRCFALGESLPVADTNIARVAARAGLGAATHRDLPPQAVATALQCLLPPRARSARDHNLALMDLGATICTARQPKCDRCPVASLCRWRAAGYPPSTTVNRPTPRFETTARFARGRIVDALRESPATTAELRAMLPEPHRQRLSAYLAALAKEGMTVQQNGTWRLPT